MKFYRALIFLLALLTLRAGNACTIFDVSVIGFSEDGHFLAFKNLAKELCEIEALPVTYFINVEKNSFAAGPIYGPDPVTGKYSSKKQPKEKLIELKIIEGNTGEHVISHPLTDIEVDPSVVRFKAFGDHGHTIHSLRSVHAYELRLSSSPGKCKDENNQLVGQTPLKFKLVLKNLDSKAELILQEDIDIPKSRGCPTSYQINDVYVYQNRVAVFLRYTIPGFEGDDSMNMVVTGTLN